MFIDRPVALPTCPKVLVAGTHSSGKTTFVGEYQRAAKGVGVAHEIARICPFRLNQEQNSWSTAWLLSTQIQTEIEAQCLRDYRLLLCDRGIPDILAYHEFAANVDDFTTGYARSWMVSYDFILIARPDPTIPMTPDELRIDDDGMRRAIQESIEATVFESGRPYEILPNDPRERIAFATNVFSVAGIVQ